MLRFKQRLLLPTKCLSHFNASRTLHDMLQFSARQNVLPCTCCWRTCGAGLRMLASSLHATACVLCALLVICCTCTPLIIQKTHVQAGHQSLTLIVHDDCIAPGAKEHAVQLALHACDLKTTHFQLPDCSKRQRHAQHVGCRHMQLAQNRQVPKSFTQVSASLLELMGPHIVRLGLTSLS